MFALTFVSCSQRNDREQGLEKQLVRKLRISRRIPAVVEDEYIESSSSEEEFEEEEEGLPELTDEQEDFIARCLRPRPEAEVLVEGFRLQLNRKDISTLAGLNWLNDEVCALADVLISC